MPGKHFKRLIQARSEHRRQRQQERVTCRRLTGVAHEQARHDRTARAGNTRDQGERLRAPIHQAVAQGKIFNLPLLLAEPVSQPQEHCEHDQHGANNPQGPEGGVNVVF